MATATIPLCAFCKEEAHFQSVPRNGTGIYFCSTRCWKEHPDSSLMNSVINMLKAGHCHVEVWHAHGPEDRGRVDGYYQGARWVRVTFYEDYCTVQRASCWQDGPFCGHSKDKTLEEPGLRFGSSDQDLLEMDKLMRGAYDSCVVDRKDARGLQ